MNVREMVRRGIIGQGGAKYTRIPRYQAVVNTLVDDFESAAEWSVSSGPGAISNDATHFLTGTQSVRLTCGGGRTKIDKTYTPGWNLVAGSHLSIDVYLETADACTINFNFANTAWTKYFYITAATVAGQNGQAGNWYHFDFYPSQATFSGGMTWTDTINAVRIDVVTAVGDCAFDSMSVRADTMTPAMMISFDDGFSSVYSAAWPIFKSRHLRATSHIISGLVGTANYMTEAQILELQADGWIIGNHVNSGVTFNGQDQAAIQARLEACATYLTGIGVTGNGPRHVAYPSGLYNPATIAAMAALGYFTGRSTWSAANCYVNTFDTPTHILKATDLSNVTTLAAAEAIVDFAKANKTVATFFGHKIEAAAAPITWAASDLAALLDYALAQGVPVITVDDYYNLYSQDVTVRTG